MTDAYGRYGVSRRAGAADEPPPEESEDMRRHQEGQREHSYVSDEESLRLAREHRGGRPPS